MGYAGGGRGGAGQGRSDEGLAKVRRFFRTVACCCGGIGRGGGGGVKVTRLSDIQALSSVNVIFMTAFIRRIKRGTSCLQ